MGFLDSEYEIEYATQPMYVEIINATAGSEPCTPFVKNNNPMENLETMNVVVELEQQDETTIITTEDDTIPLLNQ